MYYEARKSAYTPRIKHIVYETEINVLNINLDNCPSLLSVTSNKSETISYTITKEHKNFNTCNLCSLPNSDNLIFLPYLHVILCDINSDLRILDDSFTEPDFDKIDEKISQYFNYKEYITGLRASHIDVFRDAMYHFPNVVNVLCEELFPHHIQEILGYYPKIETLNIEVMVLKYIDKKRISIFKKS